jgi:branched-chain amino acid transport system ATP-binding protein
MVDGGDRPLLDIRSASVRFGGIQALDDVSCTVRESEICGLIGPNGAGKTTLFNCITGVYSLASGSIEFRGERIDALPGRKVISTGIARTFQNVGLYLDMSVLDNVLLGAHHLTRQRFAGTFVRPLAFDREERGLVAFCRDILKRLGLEHTADERAGNLPFGTLKHVEIARALASRPKLLLLDEPAAGLNHRELTEFSRLILRLRADFGLTVLLVEHNMGLVMDLCERLIVLHLGRKLAEGAPREIKTDKDVVSAYLGEAA